MKIIRSIVMSLLIAVFPSHSVLALEPISEMIEIQQGTLKKLQFGTSRCGALFMTLSKRIEKQLSFASEDNTDPKIKSMVQKGKEGLDQIRETQMQFIMWDQILSEELGDSDTASTTSMINRAMQYDRHRQSVYIAPNESLSELEKKDMQTCGGIKSLLTKE